MGLDCIFCLNTVEFKRDEALEIEMADVPVCRGIFGGENGFRGKVYAAWFEEFGIDLYEDMDYQQVRSTACFLKTVLANKSERSFQLFIDKYGELTDLEGLSKMFSRNAERKNKMYAWS